MSQKVSYPRCAAAPAVVLAIALALPTAGAAQTLTGQARAVQASTPLGGATVLADTGTLGGASDARDASMTVGQIGSLFGAEVLHAVTIGWRDQVASQVSLANVGVQAGTNSITADMVMASVTTALGAPASARALVGNLSINGIPVEVTGSPNQRIAIPGGQVVVNEQTVSAAGTTVNALRVTVLDAADVVIGSATAGIR